MTIWKESFRISSMWPRIQPIPAPASSPTARGTKRRSFLSGIAGGDYGGRFHHEDHGLLGAPGAVDDALGDDEALPGLELDGLVLEVHEELPVEDEEELVVLVVLVPVVFALVHAQAQHR